MIITYLIRKEFKQIKRNPFIFRTLFLVPIVQLLILPLAANFELSNVGLSIVDDDRSETSRRITEQIINNQYFTNTQYVASYSDALSNVENNVSDLILHYPRGMEKSLENEHYAKVFIAANAVNGSKGSLGSSYLCNIINDVEESSVRFINNQHLDYHKYMVPGIIAFIITIVAGFVSALNIVMEKEKRTIEQINVSPVRKHTFLLSKLIPFWILGLATFTFSLLTAYAAYGLLPVGSYITLYLYVGIYLFFATGLGLAISSIAQTQQQSMLVAFFFLVIFGLLSGLFTPISSMPEWAQKLTAFNPLKYFVEVQRMVYLKGCDIFDLKNHFIITTAFALLTNVIAVVGYRKKE